jgi:hypothetical protein
MVKNEYQESSWGGKGWQARKTDNLTAICEPRRLTTLWASAACYRDSFTPPLFFFAFMVKEAVLAYCRYYPSIVPETTWCEP